MIELNLTNLEDLARGTAFLATGRWWRSLYWKVNVKTSTRTGKKSKNN